MLPPPLMLLFCCLGEKTPLFLSDSARRSAFCAVARNMIYFYICVFGEKIFSSSVRSSRFLNSKDCQIWHFKLFFMLEALRVTRSLYFCSDKMGYFSTVAVITAIATLLLLLLLFIFAVVSSFVSRFFFFFFFFFFVSGGGEFFQQFPLLLGEKLLEVVFFFFFFFFFLLCFSFLFSLFVFFFFFFFLNRRR